MLCNRGQSRDLALEVHGTSKKFAGDVCAAFGILCAGEAVWYGSFCAPDGGLGKMKNH